MKIRLRIEIEDEMELGTEVEVIYADRGGVIEVLRESTIDEDVEPAIEQNFTERMADLEEFYDSASVAIREVHEVIADTEFDDIKKLVLISEILDTSIDQPLEAGDHEPFPLDDGAV